MSSAVEVRDLGRQYDVERQTSLCSGVPTGLPHEGSSSVGWVWSRETGVTGDVWEVMAAAAHTAPGCSEGSI